MDGLTGFALSAAAAAGICIAFSPFVRGPRGARTGVMLAAAGLIFCCPLIIPEDAARSRLAAAIFSLAMAAKLLEHGRSRPGQSQPNFRDFFWFFADPYALTYGTRSRRPETPIPRGPEWVRLGIALPVFSGSLFALRWLVDGAFFPGSLVFDHVTKVLVLGVAIDSLCQTTYAIGRLAGYDVLLTSDFSLLSCSPAEWWRRYNRMVGAWLTVHGFQVAGGRRHYVRATLFAFLISALAHEYVFDIATMSIDGYQTAFFMIQGVGVLVATALRRRFRKPGIALRAIGWAAHMTFMLSTLVLFFSSLDKIAPNFYAAERWLP